MFLQVVLFTALIFSLIALLNRKFKDACEYYIKFVVYLLMILVGAGVYMLKFLYVGPSYANSCSFTTVYRFSRWVLGLEPIIRGAENLRPNSPCIFMCNHQSFIDVLSLTDLWPRKCSVIAKSSLSYAGPLGLVMRYCKIIFVDRSNHERAIASLKEAAKRIREEQLSLFVFPEGTRCNTGKLMPFKKGGFHLAVQTKLPIQPIVVSNYEAFLNHKEKFFHPARFSVYVLPQINTDGIIASDVPKLMQDTYLDMCKVFDLTAEAPVSQLGLDLRQAKSSPTAP